MRSILRFLCVAVMLQVSTPLMHGMAEEAGEGEPLLVNSTYGKRVARFWQSANLKKFFRDSCTKVMCASLALMAVGGCAYPFVSPLWQKDPAASPLISKCPVYAWDRSNVSCSPRSELIAAIASCQTNLMEGDYVPVCNDFSRDFEFPVGCLIEGREGCADYMNLTGDEYPAAIVGFNNRANRKIDEWYKRGIRFCGLGCIVVPFNCLEIGFGLVIPNSLLEDAVNFTAYEEQIVGHPEDMEEVNYCKQVADKERKAKPCYGPITSNANSTKANKSKKVPPKHKTRKRRD